MSILTAALPLFFGFLLDALIGDPYRMPHPVRAIGHLISAMESFVRRHFRSDRLYAGGVFLALIVVVISTGVPAALLRICYRLHPAVGIAAESVLMFTLLAAKNLKDETMKVYDALNSGGDMSDASASGSEARKRIPDTPGCSGTPDPLCGARRALSMIVGRDTSVLDRDGIIRAAVETAAENTSDGVTAPLLYMAFFGAAGGFFYKAVNTMDSMIGYRNEKYRDLGRFAAHLDDVLNFIPSRLTALMMIAAAYLLKYDGKNAWRIFRRDRLKHDSPNSAQTESVCAGALDVRLAGDAVYFGEVHHKPYIGDDIRPVEAEDIIRADRLMYLTAVIMWIVCLALRVLLVST